MSQSSSATRADSDPSAPARAESAARLDDASARLLRAKGLFLSVRKLAPLDREATLDRECGEDARLRSLVLDLLAGEALPLPVETLADDIRAAQDSMLASPLLEPQGSVIDRYRLIERIGEGGFGVVFAAEQTHPVKRTVALKLIKLGMDTRQVIARFEAERQALAMMEHPSIAKVLDAGATATGRPYFVMELVKGTPITEYCDVNLLDIRARLALFAQVCDAVQHAHSKGIIHRDLKPSNVLVTEVGSRPLPKIIDFGIAKATGGTLSDHTVYTQLRQMIGTPEYMSPEQASVSSIDVDTRSDVYSLGVLLYELLAGQTPFDTKRLRSASYGEVQRIISEEHPPLPSTKVTKAVKAVASVDLRTRSTSIRGELDWIVMKAIEKDRERRYDSASALAADVARYLAGEAVLAAPPSRVYQARKFVRRNLVVVSAAAIAGTALLIGSIGFAWQAHRAGVERDAAVEARARAETTMEFLLSVLRKGDPTSGVGGDQVTIEQAMQAAVVDLESGRFSSDPETEARLWTALGDVLNWYTREQQAATLYQRALDALRRAFPGDHPSVAVAMSRLAYYRYAQLERDVAKRLAQDAVAMLERLHMQDTEEMLGAVNTLAIIDPAPTLEEQRDQFQRIYDMHRRFHPGDDAKTIPMMWNLGMTLLYLKQYDEGEELMSEALAMSRRLSPAGDVTLSHAIGFVAVANRVRGRHAEAERRYEESLETYRRVVRQDTLESAWKVFELAEVKQLLGKSAEAESLCTEALEYLRTREHPRTAMVLGLRARCRQSLERFTEARADFDESIIMSRRLQTQDKSFSLPTLLYRSAVAHLEQGESSKALAHLREAEELAGRSQPVDDQLVSDIREALRRAEVPTGR